MRNLIFVILFLSSSSLIGQEFVDATAWFEKYGTSPGEYYIGVHPTNGNLCYLGGSIGKFTVGGNIALNSGNTLPHSYSAYRGMRVITLVSDPNIGNICFLNVNSVHFPFQHDGTWFEIVFAPEYVGTQYVNANGLTYEIYSFPKMGFDASTFKYLYFNPDASCTCGGNCTCGGSGGDGGWDNFDFSELISYLKYFIEVFRDHAEFQVGFQKHLLKLVQEDSDRQNALGQYQIGLLSFIGGIALAFVFIFGLHLR